MASRLVVSVSKAKRPAARASRDPGLELRQLGHRLVLRAVDLRSATLRRSDDRRLRRRAPVGVAPAAGLGVPGLAVGLRHASSRRAARPAAALGAQPFGDALGQRRELHLAQEAQQRLGFGIAHAELLHRHLTRHVVLERDQIEREPRLHGELGQPLAALGLLDLAGARQQRFQIAVLVDQLGRGLDADARHARHVVGGVAGQRLHVDDLVGRHAELLAHLVGSDGLVLHGVEHDDAGLHQLHEVLVGGDDRSRRRRRPALALA